MERVIVLSLTTLICISLVSAVCSSPPSIPHAIWGYINYENGDPLPDGYIISAEIDNQGII